jgi:hypothetical protein
MNSNAARLECFGTPARSDEVLVRMLDVLLDKILGREPMTEDERQVLLHHVEEVGADEHLTAGERMAAFHLRAVMLARDFHVQN